MANYKDSMGRTIAQKIRGAKKRFLWLGDNSDVGLYGEWLWRDGGKMVVITEGEIDALSVSQVQGNKWPVVSLPNGAQSAKKAVARSLEWLSKFEAVVLMFDQDEPGKKAAEDCVALFPPGKVKIASLPLKDANEMLMAGRGAELIDAMWSAKVFRPDGIVTLQDIREDLLKEPELGLPWFCPKMTELSFGRRLGEVHMIGAGTGIGKTDFLTQQVEHDLRLGESVGVFFMEQQPAETGRRIAGKASGRQFHIPDAGWTKEELLEAVDKLQGQGVLYLYDHWGSAEWLSVRERIRYLVHSEGVRLVYLDHLTAFVSGEDDERRALEQLMAQAAQLAQELRIVLHVVSHLSTPEGKPHEEGGRVMIRHFKGSRAIGFWSHFMWALERNTQDEDEEARQVTTVRCLKARPCGWNVGKTFHLRYDKDTGLLSECDGVPELLQEL